MDRSQVFKSVSERVRIGDSLGKSESSLQPVCRTDCLVSPSLKADERRLKYASSSSSMSATSLVKSATSSEDGTRLFNATRDLFVEGITTHFGQIR